MCFGECIVLDRYELNLYCVCFDCNNRNSEGNMRSCKAYPKKNGIPPEVWNTENAECKFFISKN